ncbi:AAA family ATPase [Frigidibacter sp. RF13]|uniref:ATP-dependent nuclease n=1 Tax=Frigidibacter sp. RF13 TaxID=2997340 RepID=UPI0022700C83|nr:AAA family ATPase [Frigidibacter sp. RF13]MCY1128757.1 AAA family ATPase [Frigidibacter sp. RF13]
MKLSPNQLREEIQRVTSNNYRQFVKRCSLKNIRGFRDQVIEFKAPVTALIGTNGGGKSTILGAAALAYKDVKPGQFFPKSYIGDTSMSDWVVEYLLVDKPKSPSQNIERTARFAQAKWRRDDFPERHVEYVEIQRTVPAGELPKYRRFLGANNPSIVESNLSPETRTYAGAILDKDISHYRVVHLPDNPENKMYVGATTASMVAPTSVGYSQFHFGAGEASVIATVDRIESAPDNSLILIEEVENGLHPVAVRLMVQYLMSVARRKRHQIIFTTHSQDAVDELPPEAVWASINKRVWNGQLSIESLRAITGEVPNERVVFVEDDFVREWVENAISRFGSGLAETTRVFKAGGYPNVLQVSKYHNDNPTTVVPSVALVDGDIYDPTTAQDLPPHAKYLGDGTPESIVFDYVFDHRTELVSILRQRCLLSGFDEDRILAAIESVRYSACDPHTVFVELSRRLDFSSAVHIRSGMIDIYNEKNQDYWKDVVEFVRGGQA